MTIYKEVLAKFKKYKSIFNGNVMEPLTKHVLRVLRLKVSRLRRNTYCLKVLKNYSTCIEKSIGQLHHWQIKYKEYTMS